MPVKKKTEKTLPEGTIVPNHIAIAMDGNGRWARSRSLPATQGHDAAGKHMLKVIKASRDLGVHTLTLWGFSTENWKRSPKEVNKIFSIVKKYIKQELKNAEKEGVRFVHLGRKDRLPEDLMSWIKKAEDETKNNKKHILNLAIDYGGHDDIVRAVRKIAEEGVNPEEIDEEVISGYLDTANQPYPNPDLFIRTAGEQRTSGLMVWQMAYSEFYFEEDHLPDFSKDKLIEAILDYSRLRRRFGAKDKVKHFKFEPRVIAQMEINWWRLSKIPEGTKFRDYAINHIKDQFGVSKELATKAAKYMVEGMVKGNAKNWKESIAAMLKFYELLKEEIKLAFEPKLAATLQVQLWRETSEKDSVEEALGAEETARELYSELYRMSKFQAAKLAHLRVMAQVERNLAERGMGDEHWDKAEDYLEKFYSALKERIA